MYVMILNIYLQKIRRCVKVTYRTEFLHLFQIAQL